jgi:type IV secretory pathway TrbD component
MTTLTKDQVRKLPPEQQEALASMEVQRFHSRHQLLERARRGMTVVAGLMTGLAGGLPILCVAYPRLLPIAIVGVVGLVTFHVSRLHRRLDAVMELLDEDTKREQSDDHNAA